MFGKIDIGNNTYIGNEVIIMPGVRIGNNCVIGAGAIVTKSIPDNSVVAGIPAKFISTSEDYKKRMMILNVKSKLLNAKEKKKKLLNLDKNLFSSKDKIEY